MRLLFTPGLLWVSAIGCGLLAGVYFAFSTFVMASLAQLAPPAGIIAMKTINIEIVKSLFMPVFLLTTLANAGLVAMAVLHWGQSGTSAMAAGGILYVLGMFGVTMMFNVPLNDALAFADPASREAALLWARYLKDWSFWNHIRTAASVGACAFAIAAIAAK